MRPKQNQRNRIKKWIDKWRPRLHLGEWFIDVVYTSESSNSSAEISPDPVYLRAVLQIHSGFWNAPIKYQEMILVHELCHCISEETYILHMELLNDRFVTKKSIEDARERLTQRIANVAFRDEW